MKSVCHVVMALLAVSLVHADASTAKGDKTITKVVKLLQQMLEKSKTEGDTEANLYGKFKCYCDTNEEDKTGSIATLSKTVSLLESKIDSLQANNGELSGQTAQLKADMDDAKAAKTSADNIRKKAKEAFDIEEKDLSDAIGQMNEAIKTLAAIGGDQTMAKSASDHDKFMAGTKVKSPLLISVSSEVKNALTAASVFLNADQKKVVGSFMQGPSFTGSYSAQSGQIVGILKEMMDTFKTNLAESRATEAKDAAAHTKFMKEKTAAIASMDKIYKEKQETLGANDGALTTKKSQLQQAVKDKADAEDFLDKLNVMCAKRAKVYEERKLERANEEAAISQAISILNSDEAFETFGTTSATSTGATKASFLQLGSRRSEAALRRELKQMLSVEKSERLTKVIAIVEAGNPFATVLKEIEKMVKLNTAEGVEDKKNKEWCEKETKDNTDAKDDHEANILTMTADADKLDTTINDEVKGLIQQIKNTETTLVNNDASQKSETKQRTEDNVAYQADVKNLVDAQDLLKKAIVVLSEYYDGLKKKMEALVQEDPKAPADLDKALGDSQARSSKEGGDAVGMLEYILKETQKEEATAHATEEKAQAEYEDSMTDLKAKQATSEESLSKLNQDLATAQKDLIEKNEELKATKTALAKVKAYLAQIKPGCDFITTNYDKRVANRKTETDALKLAVTKIKATNAYKVAVQAAKEEGFGKCKDLCVADEAGAKCKACQADVTVPAYCAGHSGTPGC